MNCDHFTLKTREAGITPPPGCGLRAAALAQVLRTTPLPVNWRKGEHHALACVALGRLISAGAAVLNQPARVYQLTPRGEQWLAELEACGLLAVALGSVPMSTTTGGRRSVITRPFIAHLEALRVQHGGNKRAAVRALVRAWRAGEHVPGFGTWREFFQPAPASCPDALPQGWSERNLYELINH